MATKTILIVEDNATNMKLFNDLLHVSGYDTIKSVDGSDVLQVSKDQKPDLIIMDIHLPGRSGLELTGDLKADKGLKHIPVVAVTASFMRGDEQKFLEAGCDDYIATPIFIPTFLETMDKHLS